MGFGTLGLHTGNLQPISGSCVGKGTFSDLAQNYGFLLPVDATDSNWQQRRRCFGGYDVGATEAG